MMLEAGLFRELEIHDKSMYTCPIISHERNLPEGETKHFDLVNVSTMVEEGQSGRSSVALQYYSFHEHLWKWFIPSASWANSESLLKFFKRRIGMVRVVLGGQYSRKYRARKENGEICIEIAASQKEMARKTMLNTVGQLRKKISSSELHILPIYLGASNSFHYSMVLPDYSEFAADNFEVGDGIHVCDASAFGSPAGSSLTFTIMALAHRIARTAL